MHYPSPQNPCIVSVKANGEKATALTEREWLPSVYSGAPVPVSHSWRIPTLEADASCLPSGEKAISYSRSSAPKKQAGIRHHAQALSANVNNNNNKLLHPQYYTIFLQTKAHISLKPQE